MRIYIHKNITDYNCVRRDRITGKKGGIVVYVKNGINYIHCKEIEDDNIESIWIEVCFKNQKRILFGFIYRPPSENVMWIEYFEKQLFKASNFSQNVVLLGDFNFSLFKPNLHSRWNNLIHAFDLKQQMEKATRVSKNTATLIDHIYTSNNINIQQISVPETSLSDHYPVILIIGNCDSYKKSVHKFIKYRKKSEFDEMHLLNEIRSNLNSLKPIICNDLNVGVNNFNSVLSESYDKCYPVIEKRVKNMARIPWINKHVLDAMRQRDAMKKRVKLDKYKWWRNRVVNLIRSNKKSHFQNVICKAKGNSQKLWSHINSFCKKPKKNVPSTLSSKNGIMSGKYEIAELLNNHFVTVSSKVLNNNQIENVVYNVPKKLKQFVTINQPVSNYFVIPNVTEEFVFKELRCLDSKKWMGDDGINAGFLKMCTSFIVSYITKLINESIITSEYPSAWKIAKITALFKGGDDKDVNNYRPISILSTVSKIIEKHVYTHLYKYFSDF